MKRSTFQFAHIRPLLFIFALLLGAEGMPSYAQAAEGGTQVAANILPDAPLPTVESLHESYDSHTTSSSSQSPSSGQQTTMPDPRTTPAAPGKMTEDQVKKQESQRTLGVMPSFNVAYDAHVPPLLPSQKIKIAFHSSTDPFAFVTAGIVSLYGQATDDHGPDYETKTNSAGQKYVVRYEGYGMGWEGYGKRFAANYADSFDGNMIGNALLPILLKEDPRYFRQGHGPIRHRFLFAIESTVWARRDNGNWGPNYANVLGNIAAGGISNAYYPSYERGAGLTFERGLVVTAEGTIGALLNEFLPDLTKRYLHRDISGKREPTP